MTEVSVTRNGRTYTGHYAIKNDMITVRYKDQKKTTQVGGTDPDILAKLLLIEMRLA